MEIAFLVAQQSKGSHRKRVAGQLHADEDVKVFLSGGRPHCRGGRAQYLSGFAPDGEAKSRPRVTVACGPGGPKGYGR